MNGELPRGWAIAPLQELAAFNPKHAALDDAMEVSFIPMASVSESSPALDLTQTRHLGEVRKGYTHFADGDVLFAKITPCMENGKGAVATGLKNGIGCGTAELVVMRPSGAIDSVLLYRFLSQPAVRRAAKENFTGTAGQARVPISFLQQLEIPLPPFAEQRRIVAKLEQALAKIDTSKQRLAKIPVLLKRFRQSVLAAACCGRLTSDWRDTHPTIDDAEVLLTRKQYDIAEPEDGLADLPDKWRWAALGDYARCNRGRFSIRPRNDPSCFGGCHPFIQIGDLNPDGGWVRTHRQTLNDKGLSASRRFPKGTAVVAIVGATIGNTGLLGYDMCFPDSLVGLETGFSDGNRYIEFFLRDRKHQIRQASYSSGGQPNIKLEFLNPYPLPLPPFEEQQEIVRRVDALFKFADQIEARFEKAKAQIEKLTPALLAKAFRGELVPQDPKDEPASVLLERIRAERAATDSSEKPKRKKRQTAAA